MGVNDSRQTGLDEAVQVGSTAAKVVEGAAKAGKITAAAANGAALGGPYGAAASVAIAAAKHGKKILLVLLAILAIPLLFLVMLPTLIFGGTAQTTGDTTILNDQAAITENMNEIAFAVSDLLGSGIARCPSSGSRMILLHPAPISMRSSTRMKTSASITSICSSHNTVPTAIRTLPPFLWRI